MNIPNGKYIGILFAPDGDYVLDFRRDTIEEIIKEFEDLGSRWYFYPFTMIINAGRGINHVNPRRKRIVNAPGYLQQFEGRTVSWMQKWLKDNPKIVGQWLGGE